MKNNQLFAFLLSFLLASGVLTAQVDNFSLGPRVGVNFASLSNIDNSESITGLVLGLTNTYSINENSGLTLDILYSQEGVADDTGQELDLSYLQLPLYYNYFFGNLGESFRPKIYAGLSFGFLLSAETENQDVKEFLNTTALGVSGGVGFNYRLASRIWLNTDLRTTIGLSDINNNALSTEESIAARNFQLSLGIAFGLSKLD